MLRQEPVTDRLVTLLSRVAQRGVRATFREVLGFVSFLIFRRPHLHRASSASASEQTRYYWNALEGQGAIFDDWSGVLDPMRQTAAKTDEDLVEWAHCA